MKVALAVHETADGKFSVLAASNDCQSVISAYKAADAAGKYYLCEGVHFDRVKRIVKHEKIKKATKHANIP